MNDSQWQAILAWVDEYIRSYAAGGSLEAMQQLKMDHIRRVSRYAADLASGMRWSPEDVRTAAALGLLHDIGRFSQYREYKTFEDPLSVNHALRGVDVLRDAGILNGLEQLDRRRILDGTRYHNRRRLPEAISPDTLAFVKLIRDADKLDIYHVMDESLESGEIYRYPEVILGKSLQGEVAPELLENFEKEKSVELGHVRCMKEYFLFLMSWVYEIYYGAALKVMREERLIERVRDRFPENETIARGAGLAISYRDRKIGELKL